MDQRRLQLAKQRELMRELRSKGIRVNFPLLMAYGWAASWAEILPEDESYAGAAERIKQLIYEKEEARKG